MGGIGEQGSPDTWRPLRIRYPGSCELCSGKLAVGVSAWYDGSRRKIRCQTCQGTPESPTTPAVAVGEAGRSANRQYVRRMDRHHRDALAEIQEDLAWREEIKAEHPVLGRIVSAISAKPVNQPPPPKVKAWKKGADGEQAVGQLLDDWAASGDGLVLHDRRIPRTRANIDHVAINGDGVWVIDTKNYTGMVKVSLGILAPQQLTISGRDHTDLVRGVRTQMDRVAQALDAAAAGSDRPPVSGILCFVNAEWPLFDGTSTIRGVTVAWPKATIKLLSRRASSRAADLGRWHLMLARAFPPA